MKLQEVINRLNELELEALKLKRQFSKQLKYQRYSSDVNVSFDTKSIEIDCIFVDLTGEMQSFGHVKIPFCLLKKIVEYLVSIGIVDMECNEDSPRGKMEERQDG